MNHEVRISDERIKMPELSAIRDDGREAVSPVLEGAMYEITKYVDSGGKEWAVKELRKSVVSGWSYYPNQQIDRVFDTHVDEHQLFMKHLGEFTLPAEFYVQIEENGEIHYCILQPWSEGGVQYKEAIKNNRHVPDKQLGPLDQRLRFVEGLARLMKEVEGKIPDVDFWLKKEGRETKLVVFDTTYFYPERRGGKDRWNVAHKLGEFLFSRQEREKNEEVKEALKTLAGELVWS